MSGDMHVWPLLFEGVHGRLLEMGPVCILRVPGKYAYNSIFVVQNTQRVAKSWRISKVGNTSRCLE